MWHPATLPELNQNKGDGHRATGRGDTALSCFGGGQNKRGPFLVQAWVEMFKHVRGGTCGSRQDEKVPFKTCHYPAQQQGRAGWGRKKGQVRRKCVPHLSPNTEWNKLSSAALPPELISETLHVFDYFTSDLHLKCALAALSLCHPAGLPTHEP